MAGDADAADFVHSEAAGLRIALPAGFSEPRVPTGAVAPFRVNGDFEITASFDILQEPKPVALDTACRVSLAIEGDRAESDGHRANVTRRVGSVGTQFVCWQSVPKEKGDQAQVRQDGSFTGAKSGRLRLVRTGSVLSYYVSEGDGEFSLLRQFPFSDEDLTEVLLEATTGGPKASINVRISDFRIRAESLPNWPSSSETPTTDTTLAVGMSWKTPAFVGLGSAWTLVFALGGWLYWHHRRGRNLSSVVASGVAMPPISFACTACGKQLKAKAELAGKKVKCTQCGKAALVLQTNFASTEPVPPLQTRANKRFPHWLGLVPALVSLAILGPVIAFAYTPAAEKTETDLKPLQDYQLSLRGSPEDRHYVDFYGPEANQCVRFEPEGLRITLPAGYPKERAPTGAIIAVLVKGDFEISVNFEVLQEPEPADAGKAGTRMSLSVLLDRPNLFLNMSNFSRKTTERGDIFLTWMSLETTASGKPLTRTAEFPTPAKTGRLRMVRAGSVLAYYTAADRDETFALLQQYPFSAEDLAQIRLSGTTGGFQAALDVRFTDLHIHAESLPQMSVASPAPAESKGWLLAAGLLGLGMVLSLGIGLLLWSFTRYRNDAL